MIREFLRRMRSLGDEVMGINARNVECIYPLNRRCHFPRADDKLRTKEILARAGVPTPPTLAEYRAFGDLAHLERDTENPEGFVVKPASSFGGQGIAVLRRAPSGRFAAPGGAEWTPEDLRMHIVQILTGVFALERLSDKAFLEQLLEPEEVLGAISHRGLPDIRVIVHRGAPLMCMVRAPTSASRGRANLHQGALGLGVDIATGRTNGAILGGRRIETHPDNGRALGGIEIPRWPEVLDLACRAAVCTELGYVGVDVVIDKRCGPMVIELNARPGLAIQLANGAGLMRRIREGGVR